MKLIDADVLIDRLTDWYVNEAPDDSLTEDEQRKAMIKCSMIAEMMKLVKQMPNVMHPEPKAQTEVCLINGKWSIVHHGEEAGEITRIDDVEELLERIHSGKGLEHI